jgi:hypothetical protein
MPDPVRSPRLNLFVQSDDPQRYLPRPATEDALMELEQRILDDKADATLLVGPAGIGKSMLLRVVAQRLRRTLRVVRIGAGDISAPTLCALVLDQLHVDPSPDPEQAILLLAAEWIQWRRCAPTASTPALPAPACALRPTPVKTR